jgi:hypothetical protein
MFTKQPQPDGSIRVWTMDETATASGSTEAEALVNLFDKVELDRLSLRQKLVEANRLIGDLRDSRDRIMRERDALLTITPTPDEIEATLHKIALS